MLPYLPGPSILVDRRRKPGVELPPNCPRCDSSNTKFCYYNNYSLSQPRYFCKGCRRYWTKGGSLRNVPVGGGCRKNRRTKSARSSADRAASGESDYGCRRLQQPGSVRPDLPLDDPAASSCRSSGSAAASSAEGSRPGGADIDLALLYNKFLNQCSDFDSGTFNAPEVEVTDESFDLASVVNSDRPVAAAQLEQHRVAPEYHTPTLDIVPEIQPSNEFLPSTGDPTFYLDPSFGVPAAEGIFGNDIFWSNCAAAVHPSGLSWQLPQSPGIGMGEEKEHHLQPQPNPCFITSWNTFSSSSCQAFP